MAGPGLAASLWLMPAVLVGTALSSLLHSRVGGAKLRMGVLGFAIASGVLLLATSL